MRHVAFVAALCLLIAPGHSLGQKNDTNLKAYLDGVTERGRALFAYDQAAWHGTDAFLELKPDTNHIAHYICTKTPTGWLVTFPKWNDAHDKLLVAYEAVESVPGKYLARRYDPPKEASEDLTAQERALELAISTFQHPNRPYNTAILPAADGTIYVYLYPAQTKDTVWPLGGDVRYTIAPHGKQILETRQLHKSILEFESNAKAVGGMHSHVLSDVPEDTDVLYVLNRKPSMPEYIGTAKGVYAVNADGSISIVKR
jgi:hypothetical protein